MVDAIVSIGGAAPLPSGSDLTTLSDVRAWLGITGTADDALLQRLITSASNYIQSWLNRQFAVATYTDITDGNSGDVQAFSNYPVQSVTLVTLGTGTGQGYGQNLAGGGVITIQPSPDGFSQGYVFDPKFLYLIGYRFARGRMNVKITYTAGYTTIPQEISQACIELISLRYKERTRIGEVSKHLAGETITYSQKDFPEGVRTILNNYRKVISY